MSGFSLGESVNSAADWVSRAPIIHTIVNNPIYTALLITALCAIVALALYSDALRNGGAKLAMRAALYFGLLVTAVMFVHHYAVTKSARETSQQKGIRDVFAGIQHSRESTTGGAGQAPMPSVKDASSPDRLDNVSWEDLEIEDVVYTSPMR
jgi:hypothetical protein